VERKFTIGEIARIFNLSKDTLRYYDDIDLIKPWIMGDNGYRYYTRAQFDMISTIIFLRNADTPIKEIKDIIVQNDIGLIENKLRDRKLQVEMKIENLQKTILRLDILQDHLHSISSNTGITTERIANLWLMSSEISDLDELDVEETSFMHNPSATEWISFATVMSTLPVKEILNRKFHRFNRFGYVSEQPFPFESKHVKKIDNQLFVCANTKVYSRNYNKIDSVYEQILEYIDDNNLEITGETIERNMFDLYNAKDRGFTHFFMIYVPVHKKF